MNARKILSPPKGFDLNVWSSLDQETQANLIVSLKEQEQQRLDEEWKESLPTNRGNDPTPQHTKDHDASDDNDDSDDDDDDIILLAKFAKVDLTKKNKNPDAMASMAKREKEAAERARQIEVKQKKQEQEKAKTRSHASKRYELTSQSVQALINSKSIHANAFQETEEDITDVDIKDFFKQASEFESKNQKTQAITALVSALKKAETTVNHRATLSAAAWLGNLSLSLGSTRDAIRYFRLALSEGDLCSITAEQKKALVLSLQRSYLDVGDKESALNVLSDYGFQLTGNNSLPASLQATMQSAMEQALAKKNLEPLQLVLDTFVKTSSSYESAIVNYALPEVGMTPLHAACGRNHVEIAQVLLQHGANVSARDADGATPLLYAARFNGVDVLPVLFRHGARFDGDCVNEEEVSKWSQPVKETVARLAEQFA